MKATIRTSRLRALLDPLEDSFEWVTLRAQPNVLQADAKDDYLEAVVRQPSHVGKPGSITVRLNQLIDSLGAFRSDEGLRISKCEDDMSGDITPNLLLQPFRDLERIQSIPAGVRGIRVTLPDLDGCPWVRLKLHDFRHLAKVAQFCGVEKYRPELRNWMLRVLGPNHCRAAAGEGGIFVAEEKQRIGLLEASGAFDLLIPGTIKDKQNAGLLTQRAIRGLQKSGAKELTLHQTESAVVIKTDSTTLVLRYGDADRKWVNEMKFVDRPATCRMVASVPDLKRAINALNIVALAARKQVTIPAVSWSLSEEKRRIVFRADEDGCSASSVLPLTDAEVAPGDAAFAFACSLSLLMRMTSCARPHRFVQMEWCAPEQPMIVRYTDDPLVCDGWRRDEQTMSRSRKVLFFGAKRAKR